MHCPNYPTCQLVHIQGFVESDDLREDYILKYCTDIHGFWASCKRFNTHRMLHFCPDFVFPDTPLTVDEIMDRFDDEINQGTNKEPKMT